MRYEESVEFQLECRAFDYPTVLTQLESKRLTNSISVDELTMLGISQFRLGLFEMAEKTLLDAAQAGSLEAEIELMGCRMALLKVADTRELSEALISRTSGMGFLHSMALRWGGVITAFTGNVIYGIGLMTQAYREFQAVGTVRGMQITSNMLGAAYILRGDLQKAEFYIKQSLKLSDQNIEHAFWVDTGIKLFMVYVYQNRVSDAEAYLNEMRSYIKSVSVKANQNYFRTQVQLCEVVLHRLKNDKIAFVYNVAKLQVIFGGERGGHVEALLWIGPLILDSISRMGQHQLALMLLSRVLPDKSTRPIVIRVVEAVIWLRKGGHRGAIHRLEDTMNAAIAGGQRLDAIRCELHLADALYKSGKPARALEHLNHALSEVLIIGENFFISDDLESIKSVMMYGETFSGTRELLSQLKSGERNKVIANQIKVKTFGALEFGEDVSVKLRLSEQDSLLILIYMTVRPDRTVDQIARDVLTEKYLDSPEAAYSYIRQAIMLFRKGFGQDIILSHQERKNAAARYRINEKYQIRHDLDDAYDALTVGDLDKLFEIYEGRFAAKSYSDFAEEINDALEGAIFQHLLNLAQGEEYAGHLKLVLGWARNLLALAPENEGVVDFIEALEQHQD